MEFQELLECLKKHRVMTDEHFNAITGQENICKCSYCRSKAGPIVCNSIDVLAYESSCNFCDTRLYYSNKRVMPYPHWDVFITSYPSGKTMSYTFCERCKQKTIFCCSDCKFPEHSFCKECL